MFKRKNDDFEKPKSKRKRGERNWLWLGLSASLIMLVAAGAFVLWFTYPIQYPSMPLPDETAMAQDGILPPTPMLAPPLQPVGVLPCNDLEVVTEKLESGGTWGFQCIGAHMLPRPIRITRDTTLIGSDTMGVVLNGRGVLESIFRVENGATLTLKDISLASSTRYGVYVASGSTLSARDCSFAYIGSEFGPSAAILNDGTVELFNCWLGENGNDANFMNAALVSSLYSSTIIRQSNFIGNETAIQAYGALTLDNIIFGDNETDCIATNTLIDPDGVCQPGQP
jgi:hypothetical protein